MAIPICLSLLRKAGIKKPPKRRFFFLRRKRDSNPRYPFGAYTLSRRAPSTTRTLLRLNRKNKIFNAIKKPRTCGAFSYLKSAYSTTVTFTMLVLLLFSKGTAAVLITTSPFLTNFFFFNSSFTSSMVLSVLSNLS